jgi:DNA-binding LacI/PurR family transcriptional regulator
VPVTLQDVARRAGVSTATVSRVLANKPYVREETRQRVLAVVEELGYQPNRVARSLRTRHCNIIGLIISDIQNPFFTSLVRAVEDVAYEHQYAVFLCNSDEDLDKEALYIDLMRAERVSGVVISPTRERETPCHKLVESNVPVVAVDRRIMDLEVDTVVVDNVGASFDLTSHLIEDGHRRIGAVFGRQIATTGRERREGYARALKAHNLPILPDLVRSGLPKEALGYQFARELLDLPDRPTALYAGNNLLAIGAIKAIYERGLRIPDDMALASFDEMDWTSLVQPALTVIAQPTYQLGRTAAGLLLGRIQDSARPTQTIVLKPRLVVRGSCAHHGTD